LTGLEEGLYPARMPDNSAVLSAGIPEPCCTLRIDGSEQVRLVRMFKALGNPIRFEILKFLLTHPGCITGDLVEYLPIAQATVSQHLKVLRTAGWIEGRVQGPATRYCLIDDHVAWFRSQVGNIF
jgi:DNA-binding transcriptional ArsR family regulator